MREEEDKVGREVTTRILYILWNIYHQDFPRWLLSRATRTCARRTSEGVKRAPSRLSFLSSAAISRSFSSLPTYLLLVLLFSHPVVLFLSALCEADPAGEKWRRQKCVRVVPVGLFTGQARGRAQVTLYTLHLMSTFISRPLFRITSNAFSFSSFLPSVSDLQSGCL